MTQPTTVEELVRSQLATALGGRRGMLEAAVPTAAFTVVFLIWHDLRLALTVSIVGALILLVVRLAQRSSPQYVINSLVGIGIGALFAARAARGGGDASDQALAYFLPGILYNAGYAVVIALSIVVRWPVVGIMLGGVTGGMSWRNDPATVRLCARLSWLLVAPCVLRVIVQAPIYLAGRADWHPDAMVAALGATKLAMGWPLQVLALLGMAWVLGRNRTPLNSSGAEAR